MRRAQRRRRRGGQTGKISAELTTLEASPYRARASRPARQPAAVAPPLLCEEGNIALIQPAKSAGPSDWCASDR